MTPCTFAWSAPPNAPVSTRAIISWSPSAGMLRCAVRPNIGSVVVCIEIQYHRVSFYFTVFERLCGKHDKLLNASNIGKEFGAILVGENKIKSRESAVFCKPCNVTSLQVRRHGHKRFELFYFFNACNFRNHPFFFREPFHGSGRFCATLRDDWLLSHANKHVIHAV